MRMRRATVEDRLAISVTAVRAFADDPVMRWLYPEDEVFFAPGGEVLRPAMTGWIGLGEVWCTDDGVGRGRLDPAGPSRDRLHRRPAGARAATGADGALRHPRSH